jgi:hypothetical protein
MPALGQDQTLQPQDLALLRDLALGLKQPLFLAVERFYPVVFGLALYRTRDPVAAERHSDGVLRAVLTRLLAGQILGDHLVRAIDAQLDESIRVNGQSAAGQSAGADEALHSLHGAKKLQRRRAVTDAIYSLPLNQFLALVLRYHGGWTPNAMVGIVADTVDGVRDALAAGHRAAVSAFQSGG